MTDDKGRKDQGGFFDNEKEDGYLSEKTVVDTDVLKKLHDRLKVDDEVIQDLSDGAELLDEVVLTTPPTPPVPPQPSVPEAPPLPPTPPVSTQDETTKQKVEKVHELFEQPEDESVDLSEIAEEKTVILADEDVSGAPKVSGAKLVVEDGPDKGKEYTIEFNEIFIGRGVENDFAVADRAISRKHFRIRRRFDEYIIVDLKSGNGTRVNSEKVEEVLLNHGDVIVVGRSSIRFIDLEKEAQGIPAVAPVAEPAPPIEPTRVKATPVERPVEPVPEPKPKPEPKVEAKPEPKVEAKPEPKPEIKPEAVAPTRAKDRLEPLSAQRSGTMLPGETDKATSFGLLFVGIIVVVCVVAGLILITQYYDEEAKQAPTPVTQQPPTVLQKEAKIKKLIDQAEVLVQNRFFTKGVDKFNEVLAIDKGNTRAEMGKVKAQREIANNQALDEGKQLFNEQKFKEAAIRLQVIGDSSVFHPKAQAMLKKIEDAKYDAEVEKGKGLLEKKKYDSAIAVFDGVLAQSATHEGARKYKQIALDEKQMTAKQREEQARLDAERRGQAEAQRRQRAEDERRQKAENERRKKAEEQKRIKAEQDRREREQREAEAQKRREEEQRKRLVQGNSDLDKGIGLYKNGKLDQAVVELYTIANGRGNTKVINKAKSLVASMKRFNESYDAGKKAHAAKNPAAAIPKLKNAMREDMKIASGSAYVSELRQKLADMYYLIGNSAKQSQSWEKAYTAYNRSLQFYPQHGPAKQGIESLSNQARKLYYEGFAIKDVEPEQTEQKWKTVKKIVPSSNEWYKKADAGLQDL